MFAVVGGANLWLKIAWLSAITLRNLFDGGMDVLDVELAALYCDLYTRYDILRDMIINLTLSFALVAF